MNPVQVRKKVIAQLAKIKLKKGIYTFVSKPEDYSTVNKAIISYLTKKLKFSGVYVSLNKSCDSLSKELKAEKISLKQLLFIDGASQDQKSTLENCICLQGNKSLTELSLTLTEACKNKIINFVFLDSVSTLLIYNNLETTERFVHYIINKIKNLDIFVVLISIEEDKSNKLMPILAQFCDGVIRI